MTTTTAAAAAAAAITGMMMMLLLLSLNLAWVEANSLSCGRQLPSRAEKHGAMPALV